jgi:hypothetical protein
MRTRDEVIGSVVERVIPEGWHGVYVDTVSDSDLAAYRGKWHKLLGHGFAGQLTDTACEASGFFVIRQDAPEPSVEDVAALKARIAEMEAEKMAHPYPWRTKTDDDTIKALKDTLEVVRTDLRRFTKWHADAAAKLNAVKKAWEGV